MLDLTPQLMEAVYSLLLTCRPFSGWGLPPAEEVEFHVFTAKDRCADYGKKTDGTHVIRANMAWIGTLEVLVRKMAHEMVHMHCDLECPNDQAHHGWRFRSEARKVCRVFCWDWKNFC